MFKTGYVDWDREFDSEVKLFETFASHFNPNRQTVVNDINGVVNVLSELIICLSCAGVANQFQTMFPNEKLNANSDPNQNKPEQFLMLKKK